MNGEDTTFTVPDIPARRIVKEPCPECDKPINPSYMREHRRKVHGTVLPGARPGRKPKNGVGKLHGHDVVITVLEAVFPNGIPVKHFDAVNAWREQTIAFLKRVQL